MTSCGGKNFGKISGLPGHVQVHRVVHVGEGEEALQRDFELYLCISEYLVVDEDLDEKQGRWDVDKADLAGLVVDVGVPDLGQEAALGRDKRIGSGHSDLHIKLATLVRASLGPQNSRSKWSPSGSWHGQPHPALPLRSQVLGHLLLDPRGRLAPQLLEDV